jgi:hypothetical protein
MILSANFVDFACSGITLIYTLAVAKTKTRLFKMPTTRLSNIALMAYLMLVSVHQV